MKQEYDFSQGTRGKFYNPDATFHIPVYLEQDSANYLIRIAEKQNLDINNIVNNWIKRDIAFLNSYN